MPVEEQRLPAMVVSHERSGTHFLMNALAAEFGFDADPGLAFDPPVVNINYFHPRSIRNFLHDISETKTDLIIKSHHHFDFFREIIEQVAREIHIFYIYRDPRDVCHSFRHFLQSWPWFEGPKIDVAGDFIRAAPAGQMLRYQYFQAPDMLHRWQSHVEGWLDAAAHHPEITPVRYEALNDTYDDVIDAIAAKKGWPRQNNAAKPEINKNTVLESQKGSPSNRYSAEDLDYFRRQIGGAMERLGYKI